MSKRAQCWLKYNRGLEQGKRFIPDVTRIYTLDDSAYPPKASIQTIQQAPSSRKTEEISKTHSVVYIVITGFGCFV